MIRIIFVYLLLVMFFSVSSCNSKKKQYLSACLTAEEKADLDYFFRMLMFENHGAFVLFGSKPICEMFLRDTESKAADIAFQQWFDSLPEMKQAEFKARMKNKIQKEPELKRNPYRGWLALQKALKTLKTKRFLFRIVPLRGPGRYELMLINIHHTSLVMTQNYTAFRNAARMDFSPIQATLELRNPDSVFWKNILSNPNHITKGLLFGFGLKNSIFGNLRLTYSNSKISSELKKSIVKHLKAPSHGSRIKDGEGSPSNFTIPLFTSIEGDDWIEKYKKEKVEIEKIYLGKDLVEVTLQRLVE